MALLQGIAKAAEKEIPKLVEKSTAYKSVVKQLKSIVEKFGWKSEEARALLSGAAETHKIPAATVIEDVNAAAKAPAKIKAPAKDAPAPVKEATAKLPKASRKPTSVPKEKLAPVSAAEAKVNEKTGTVTEGKKASPDYKGSDKTPAAKYRAQLMNISQMMLPENEIPAEVLNATIEDAAKVTGRTTDQVVADVAQFKKRNALLGETKYIEGAQAEALRQQAVDAGVDPALAARFKFEEQKYAPSRLNKGTEANTPARTRQYRATIELTPEEKVALGNTRFAGKDDRMIEQARATGKYTVSANTPDRAAQELQSFHQELKAPAESPAHPSLPKEDPAKLEEAKGLEPVEKTPADEAAALNQETAMVKRENTLPEAPPSDTPNSTAELTLKAEENKMKLRGDEDGTLADEAMDTPEQKALHGTPEQKSLPETDVKTPQTTALTREGEKGLVKDSVEGLGIPSKMKAGETVDAQWRPKGTVDPKLAGTAAMAVGATALASRAMSSGAEEKNALSIPAKNAPKPLSKEEQIAADHNGPAPVPDITPSQTNKDVVKFVPTAGGQFPVYKKDSPSAVAFRAAFHAARTNGEKTFMFGGLKYNTRLK